MKRILFVDDEPALLSCIRRSLHRERSRWEMVFVETGREALEYLARGHVDVVVSDMRMPDLDGAEVLSEVRARSPSTVRLMLSGSVLTADIERGTPVAHELIGKPCAAD